MKKIKRNLLGFVLIELMVAVTLGLLLVSIILEIYLASIRSFHLQQALIQLQHNAKIAIDILNSEIHKAGNLGCARLTTDFPIFSSTRYTLTHNNRISSDRANEITIRHASFPNAMLKETMHDTSSISVTTDVHFSLNEILIISDCQHADIFQVKEVKMLGEKQILNTYYPLHHKYEVFAEVSKLDVNSYFVANTHRYYPDGKPIYSLFVKNIHQRKSELVEGIQAMEIRYSLNRDGEIVDSKELENGATIVGISIDFTISSPPINKIWHLYTAVDK